MAFGPAFFSISGTRSLDWGEGFGCTCAICGRAISAPHRFQGSVIWCLYCGMERGLVPAVEAPGGLEFASGITREEAVSIAQNVHRLDDWAIERDRALGRLVDI